MIITTITIKFPDWMVKPSQPKYVPSPTRPTLATSHPVMGYSILFTPPVQLHHGHLSANRVFLPGQAPARDSPTSHHNPHSHLAPNFLLRLGRVRVYTNAKTCTISGDTSRTRSLSVFEGTI
jgi:hypothetical protein